MHRGKNRDYIIEMNRRLMMSFIVVDKVVDRGA